MILHERKNSDIFHWMTIRSMDDKPDQPAPSLSINLSKTRWSRVVQLEVLDIKAHTVPFYGG